MQIILYIFLFISRNYIPIQKSDGNTSALLRGFRKSHTSRNHIGFRKSSDFGNHIVASRNHIGDFGNCIPLPIHWPFRAIFLLFVYPCLFSFLCLCSSSFNFSLFLGPLFNYNLLLIPYYSLNF